jgi:hypothetical protein
MVLQVQNQNIQKILSLSQPRRSEVSNKDKIKFSHVMEVKVHD